MGGLSFPARFDVLVTTPAAFEQQQSELGTPLAWRSFDVVVFDECHHVLKQHPYRKLAVKLNKERKTAVGTEQHTQPRVIGLTASVTYRS